MSAPIPCPVSEDKQKYVLGVMERLAERDLIDYEIVITDEDRVVYEHAATHPAERPTLDEFITVLFFIPVSVDDAEEIVDMWEHGVDRLPKSLLALAHWKSCAHALIHT